jgi:hypothetical protein
LEETLGAVPRRHLLGVDFRAPRDPKALECPLEQASRFALEGDSLQFIRNSSRHMRVSFL